MRVEVEVESRIKRYLLELFSLHGCEYIGNDEPTPVSSSLPMYSHPCNENSSNS